MKIGDNISVLDDDLKGVIVSISSNHCKIEDEHGFVYEIPKEKLVALDYDFYSNTPVVPQKEEQRRTVSKKHQQSGYILDLHFEKLVDSVSGYSSFERLFIQKDKLLHTLDYCRGNFIKKLEIIHGIGDGVLQQMVIEVLEHQSGIEFHHKEILLHQSGAVVVYFL